MKGSIAYGDVVVTEDDRAKKTVLVPLNQHMGIYWSSRVGLEVIVAWAWRYGGEIPRACLATPYCHCSCNMY